MNQSLPCIICLWEYLEIIKTNRNPCTSIPTSQVDTTYCYCMQESTNVCRSGNILKTLGFFFQALYFSYGFGAFVSPLIAEPFLSGTPHPDLGLPAARRGNPLPYGGMGHRSHHKLSHRPTNHLRDTYYPGSEKYKSEVQVAYWIIALAHVSFLTFKLYPKHALGTLLYRTQPHQILWDEKMLVNL